MADQSDQPRSVTEEFEQLLGASVRVVYVLRLYVSGMTARSTEAINNLTCICEEYLHGCYRLEVVDIYKHPETAGDDQIIATPTLIKQSPLPKRKLVGTLSDEGRVLYGLDLVKKS